MRNPRRPQSPLQAPLNTILGTEANVRLLRALVLAGTPLGAGELARRAQIGRTNIYPALAVLERTGVIEFVGAGARRLARFRAKHPLARALRALFRTEEQRLGSLAAALRGTLKELSLRPLAAWLEEAVDPSSDTMRLYVVSDPQSLTGIVDTVNDGVTTIERSFGVHLDISGLTRSELEARPKAELERLRDAILLAGVPPTALASEERTKSVDVRLRSHEDHDVRARRLAVAIAAKLKSDPGLVRVAKRQVRTRIKVASSREQRELKEWVRILDTMSNARLQRFLLEDSERAIRLRQSLPGLGLLTQTERETVLASSTDEEVRAAVARR